jgi:hypothetical protein
MPKVEISAQIAAVNSVLTTGEINEEALAAVVKTLKLIESDPAYFRAMFELKREYPEYARTFSVFPGAKITPVQRTDLIDSEDADDKTRSPSGSD